VGLYNGRIASRVRVIYITKFVSNPQTYSSSQYTIELELDKSRTIFLGELSVNSECLVWVGFFFVLFFCICDKDTADIWYLLDVGSCAGG